MEKTKKNILGLLGLFLVAAVTTFAALLPLPGANAVNSASSVTDNVSVRVVGDTPKVGLTSPENELITKDPNQTISFDYENVSRVTVEITYEDLEGNIHTYQLDNFDADYNAGSKSYTLNLDEDERFGYGDYTVRVVGDGYGAENVDEDVIAFHYSHHIGGVDESSDGTVTVDPGVDPEDERITRVEINVYNEAGEIVNELSPVDITAPFDPVELPFAEKGLPTGWYTIEITEYDSEGNIIHQRDFRIYYEAPEIPVPSAGAPDTGGLFAGLNISRADYLITGLIIFGLTALASLICVIRGRRQKAHSASAKKRH